MARYPRLAITVDRSTEAKVIELRNKYLSRCFKNVTSTFNHYLIKQGCFLVNIPDNLTILNDVCFLRMSIDQSVLNLYKETVNSIILKKHLKSIKGTKQKTAINNQIVLAGCKAVEEFCKTMLSNQ